MPTLTDQAICIRQWEYSETSQTICLLTREHGLIKGIAKGSRRPNAPFSGGFDVLTIGQVTAITKPSTDLATLTQWHLQRVFRHVHEHLGANRAALYMADMVQRLLTDHDPHPAVFDGLSAALAALADHVELGLLAFQWGLLTAGGFTPVIDRDASTGHELPLDVETLAFSPHAGGVVLDTGEGDRWRVRAATIGALRAIAAGDQPTQDLEVVQRANRLLAAYLREIVGRETAAMRWAFSDLPGSLSRSVRPTPGSS